MHNVRCEIRERQQGPRGLPPLELEDPRSKYWVDVKTEKAGVTVTERFLQVEEENPFAFDVFVTKESLERAEREREGNKDRQKRPPLDRSVSKQRAQLL